MKKISSLYFCLITLIIISPLCVSAKELEEKIFTYGGSSWDFFRDVTATSDGGYVAVGESESTDIEGITNKGSDDAIIVKYDKNNNIEWQKNYGGSGNDYFEGITTTTDGGYVAVGESESTDIEEITNKGSDDAIIVKYDKDGNIKWQKSYGGSGNDYFKGVTLTSDGGYIAVGYTKSKDIEGITNKGDYDAIIVKYDNNGNIEWQKNYGGSSTDYFEGITTTTDGGCVAVGSIRSTDIEGITNKGSDDAIIVKYDKEGNVEWQKNYGGSSNDWLLDVTTTDNGGYVAVGYTTSTDIEGITNNDNYDGIIIKYDKEGNVEWQKNYGGSSIDLYTGVTTSNGGYVAVGLSFSTDIEGITNKGNCDTIMVKYDKEGNVEWQKTYGGNGEDWFSGIAATTDDMNIVAVGYTTSTDIEGINEKGYLDAIIVKLSIQYGIEKEETSNGNFEVIQEGNTGKITINPDTGYELDEIIITNSSGNRVDYYEKDGDYYFNLTDDVTVSVKYKEIVNPNTGINNPYLLLIIIISISTLAVIVAKKKKYI